MIDVIKNGPEEERQKLAKENGKYYIVLDAMNPFYRRLMYQEVEKQYKDLISLAKLDKDNKVPSPLPLHARTWAANHAVSAPPATCAMATPPSTPPVPT